MDQIEEKIYTGNHPLTEEEALFLLENKDLLAVGSLADRVRWRLHPEREVSFVVDRNINYTDGCITGCGFCGFHLDPNDAETLTFDELQEKVSETVKLGGTGVLLQGGMNPNLPWAYYPGMLKAMKSVFPEIHIHGFSPPEIHWFSEFFHRPVENIISELMEAGLDSIPGGGAEILSDPVRSRTSPKKCNSDQWIDVMRKAHGLGLKTTATMMFGVGESLADRVEHLRRIRELQNETGGFTAFIPWPYQIYKKRFISFENTGVDYLKTLAVARCYLHNIPNIQASWVTQGKKMGQVALMFGANDMGSTMIEENVVRSVGVSHTISREEMIQLIHSGGFDAFQRSNVYSRLKNYPRGRQ
ncbi:MAG: dehypoxanthine futalosine cyclase [Acidobacteria bacterium]|nr:dehypoxanthine futalosine cyclase [Acidobacteriota bacterium]